MGGVLKVKLGCLSRTRQVTVCVVGVHAGAGDVPPLDGGVQPSAETLLTAGGHHQRQHGSPADKQRVERTVCTAGSQQDIRGTLPVSVCVYVHVSSERVDRFHVKGGTSGKE